MVSLATLLQVGFKIYRSPNHPIAFQGPYQFKVLARPHFEKGFSETRAVQIAEQIRSTVRNYLFKNDMAALDETVPRFVPTRRDKLRSSTDDFKKHFLMYCMFLGSTHLQKSSGDASSTRVATGDSGATCTIVASNVRLLHLVQKTLNVILTTRACCIADEGSRTLRTKQGFLESGH